MQASHVLERSASCVPLARRYVRQALRTAGADDMAEHTGALLASELVTNAVLHARSPHLTLTIDVSDDAIRVGVLDDSPALPQPRRYAVDSATGRGLRLLETMSQRWGVDSVPPGKTVWFEVPLRSSDTAGADAASSWQAQADAL